MTADVPAGYGVVRPARADLAPVAGLLEARDLARFGAVTTPPESLTQLWDLPRFTPHADSWLIEDAGGWLDGALFATFEYRADRDIVLELLRRHPKYKDASFTTGA